MIGSPFSRDDPPSPLFCRISFHTGVQHVGWALIKSRPLPLGSSQCPLQENPLRWDKPIFGMDNETDSSFNGRRRKVAGSIEKLFHVRKADGPACFH